MVDEKPSAEASSDGSMKAEQPLVLITGASGLIGIRAAQALIEDHRVVGLDVIEPPEGYPDAAGFVECDLTSDQSTDDAVRTVVERFGQDIASVIHLAAYYDFSGEPSPLYRDLTIEGTRRLLHALQAHARARQMIFSSSLLVMQPTEPGTFLDESSDVFAEWDYPQSKLDTEAVLKEEHGDVPVVILRIAGAYDEWGHSPPITHQVWRIREKKLESFFFPGNRSHGQSFVHLDDVTSCLRDVVLHRDDLGPWELFLIGEPEVLSYGELQDRIGDLVHGREWPTLRIPAPAAKAGAWLKEKAPIDGDTFIKPWMVDLADAHYPVSIDHAKRKLGWEPRHRLEDTLPAMIENMKRDPERFDAINDLPGTQSD